MSYCGNCGAEILEKEKGTHCYDCGMIICDKCSKMHPAKFGELCYFAVKKNVNNAGILSGTFYGVIHYLASRDIPV